MKNKEIQSPSKTVKNSSSYKLIIPASVERKIREWCAECPDLEWSGTLFYKISGSFETNDLEVHTVDFLVSDIGSSGHTEYEFNEEVIEYMTNRNLLDCYCGLLHSHNTMAK